MYVVKGFAEILCTQCGKWIHKRSSGVKGCLESCKNFKCGKCLDVVASDEMSDSKAESTIVGLEFVDTFCYLGDMCSAGGGVEETVHCRVRCAWGTFNEVNMPMLTMRGTSLKVKGKIYKACVQSMMMSGSEIWAMKVKDTQKLKRTEESMRRRCGVSQRSICQMRL